MQVETYLFLNGRCEEALDFYRETLGAEVTSKMRFKDSPHPEMTPPGGEEKIMHATVTIGDTTVMASDGRCDGAPEFKGFSMDDRCLGIGAL